MLSDNRGDELDRLRIAVRALVKDSCLPTLSTRNLAILLTLSSTSGPHTVRGLASSLQVPKPAVTRAVDSLEAAKLAVRQPDHKDGRSKLIEPTQRGLDLVACLGLVMGAPAAAEPEVRTGGGLAPSHRRQPAGRGG
jgi:DNA-binding MarR family transcriptional regulator